MSKDSQPDDKRTRMRKCRGQTPIIRENLNQTPNAKNSPFPATMFRRYLLSRPYGAVFSLYFSPSEANYPEVIL